MQTSEPVWKEPVARGPLLAIHAKAGATIGNRDGWEIALRYPISPPRDANAIVDLSHWTTVEVNGPRTAEMLHRLYGVTPEVRRIATTTRQYIYRVSERRAIVFAGAGSPAADESDVIDVTGGWSSIALFGPDGGSILSKVTAVDLRAETLPVESCCQGPLFGVNTLLGRFANRFELHICSDSAEFFWEVLMDAGREFGLAPAGADYYNEVTL